MPKTIEPKLRKIGDYLKLTDETTFSIPEYQRPYSWKSEQCDKLWQDIKDFNGNDPYFFGTIIIDCGEEKVLSLIDGQQRTTTFLLLLKALLIKLIEAVDKIPKDEEHESLLNGLIAKRNAIMKILYRAEDETIHSLLKDFSQVSNIVILKNESINESYREEVQKILSASNFNAAEAVTHKRPNKQKDNKYTNYFRNFKFFYEKLNEMDYTAINSFTKKFLEKCEVIEIRSWNVDQAITMFNSLNSDGLPLTDADIISAKLYSNAGPRREHFNAQWESLLNAIKELEKDKIADIDAILMQYMYIERAKRKEYVTAAGAVDVTVPGLRRYYTDINKNLLDEPIALCNNLLKTAELWLEIKEYPTVKLALKFNGNIKFFLAGFLSRYESAECINKEEVDRICLCFIKLFSIFELVDVGYSSSKFKTFLFGINVNLVDKNVDISEIESDFAKHISSSWEKDDIQKELLDYNKNILVYLNEYLFAQSKGLTFEFADKCDVEHIMPASGGNIESIREDAGITDREVFNGLVNQLGNKILLEARINRSIGNNWFRTKLQGIVSDRTGYRDSKYVIAIDLVNTYGKLSLPLWRKTDIEVATNKVTERIIRFIFG